MILRPISGLWVQQQIPQMQLLHRTCPAFCIYQVLTHTESPWNATWVVLHQLLNNPDSPYWISEMARTLPEPEYVHFPAVQTRDMPIRRNCSRLCCSSVRTVDDAKQHLLPSFSRLSAYREEVPARPWLPSCAVQPAPADLRFLQSPTTPCCGWCEVERCTGAGTDSRVQAPAFCPSLVSV